MHRLFDQNAISLTKLKFKENYRQINNAILFFKEFRFMDEMEEKNLKRSLYNTDGHTFIIKYQVKIINSRRECITEEILPERLGCYDINHLMQDYKITFHPVTKQITNVANRAYGEVMFHPIKLDDQSGYVIGSTLSIWSSKVNQDVLNILHIHLNDTSEEAAIEVVTLLSSEEAVLIDEGDFTSQVFKKDTTGVPLRYKILVYDMKVKAVLYNTGASIESINFKEMRIHCNGTDGKDFINVQHLSRRKFGRVTHIPIAMLAAKNQATIDHLEAGLVKNEMAVHCEARCFEKLLGYIDVDVLSTDGLCSIKTPPERIAVAVCKIEPASSE